MMANFADIANSIAWRNAYLDPLNYIQIRSLKRLSEIDNRMQSQWLKPVLNTISDIATGLRNAG
ncbi:MAG: phosphoenolpyruvate carboxylase [Cellvibrionaceae bacterium]|jgi:phosphoenolpyruvate carboxylase